MLKFKYIILFFGAIVVLILPLNASAGLMDDYSLRARPFGGKIELIIPPIPTCPFTFIKIGNPVPIEAYIISGGILDNIPGLGNLLRMFSPSKVYDYKPNVLFEWSLGITWSKTITKPIIEGLKALPPPANIPFLGCDSDNYVVRVIGTGARPALGL